MIESAIFYAQIIATAGGILGLFVVGVVEEVIFIIPANVIFMALGFLLVDPNAPFIVAVLEVIFFIVLPTALGVVCGTTIIYSIVYWGGEEVVKKLGYFVGVRWKDVERFRVRFEKGYSDEVVIIIARMIPVVPISVISIICGLLRIRWWEFIWTTFLGVLPRIMGLALLGWYVGSEYREYAQRIESLEVYVLGVAFLATLGIFFYWRFKKRAGSIHH